jgi:hypothetical protein
MKTAARVALIGSIFLCLNGAQAQSPEPVYTPVTALKLIHAPVDPCATSCASRAATERDKLGPLPPVASAYRPSTAQASEARAILVRNYEQRTKKKVTPEFLPIRDALIKDWSGFRPKGDFNPNDVADVIAKYWIFSWVFGGGIDPNAVTPQFHDVVKTQVHEIFTTDPTLSKLTEGQRQALAESLMRTHYAYMLSLYLLANDKKQLLATMDSIIKQFNSEFGVDILKLTLTNTVGFVWHAN